MKKAVFFLFIVVSMVAISNAQTPTSSSAKLLRHVVLFKFKDSAASSDVNKVEEAFRALPSKIKEVKAFEWGLNNSPEKLNQGFTHCFFVSFESEKDRGIYLPHPAHKDFVKILEPIVDKVLVFDYWVEKSAW